MTPAMCEIISKVFAFCQSPGGRERLDAFLDDQEQVLTIDEVAALTRWSVAHIHRLCATSRLPHIKGRPHTFIYSDLMKAIRQMQTGGDFGRRKAARKMTTTRKTTTTGKPT